MCGIAGYVALTELGPEARQKMPAMLRPMERRGPNAEGIKHWPRAVLGHRRLSILDLSPAGAQPMLSEDGEIGLVFNGCIYNFKDLRAELETCGHRFHSNCDTEVLLRGYMQWGAEAMVPKLRGMFAFGIWDNRSGELYLVRDRFGVKPLVYACSKDGIAFASTMEALQPAMAGGAIDSQAVLELFEFGFISNDRSIYEGIHKLPPATLMKWAGGKWSTSLYWPLPEIEEDSKISFEEAVEETERLLIEAVKLRLQADVTVGALLSGGIDSSLVCWAMSRLNVDVKTFTIGAKGDVNDEGEQARSIAKGLGLSHEIIEVAADSEPPFDELVAAYSEPFASQSALGMLRVSSAVKRVATVLLTGDGGDEAYLGYPFFLYAWWAERVARKLPRNSPKMWAQIRPVINSVPVLKRGVSFGDYATGGIGPMKRRHDGLPYFAQRKLFGPRLQGQWLSELEIPASADSARHLLSQLIHSHFRMYLTGEFTTKVDGGTMRHSLEARSPFLDHVLWEFAARLPARIRFHGGHQKAILREITRRHVGADVATRPKRGFNIPVSEWLMRKESRPLWEHLKSGPHVVKDGWLEQSALTQAVNDTLTEKRVPLQMWYVLVLEKWLEQNRKPEPVQAATI